MGGIRSRQFRRRTSKQNERGSGTNRNHNRDSGSRKPILMSRIASAEPGLVERALRTSHGRFSISDPVHCLLPSLTKMEREIMNKWVSLSSQIAAIALTSLLAACGSAEAPKTTDAEPPPR